MTSSRSWPASSGIPSSDRSGCVRTTSSTVGLIAGCVAIMQPFLTVPAPDLSASIAVVSFAIAIPLLAALLLVNQHEAFRRQQARLRRLSVAKAIAQGLAVVGVAAALWHVVWIAGVALLVSGLVALGVHSASFSRVEGIG